MYNDAPGKLQALLAEKARREKLQSSDGDRLSQLLAEKQRRMQLTQEEPEEEGLMARAGRHLARTGKDVVSGALDLGDFLATPLRAAANLGAEAIGSDYRFNPTSEMTDEAIDTATNGYTEPRNESEQIGSAITRDLASLPVMGGVGSVAAKAVGKGAQYVGKGLKEINAITPANLTGTALGSAAMEGARQVEGNGLGEHLGAGIAGNTAGQAIGGILGKGGLRKAAARTVSLNPKRVAAFKEAGITPTLGDVSDSDVIKSTQNLLAKSPLSSRSIAKGNQRVNEGIEEALGRNDVTGISERDIGRNLIKGAKKYKQRTSDIYNKYLNRVTEGLEQAPNDLVSTEKPLQEYYKVLNKVKTPQLKEKLANTTLGQEAAALEKIAEEAGGGIPFYDAKEIKRLLDIKISKKELGSVEERDLKALRSALHDSMGDRLRENKAAIKSRFSSNLSGKDHQLANKELATAEKALRDWDKSNKFYTKYAQTRKPHLDRTGKVIDEEAEKILSSIVTTRGNIDEQKFLTGANSLKGTAKREFTDAVIDKMGNNLNDEWSPVKFAKSYNKSQPETQRAFKKQLPRQTREKFDAVMDSISGVSGRLAEVNTSKTEYTKIIADTIKKYGGAAAALAAGTASAGLVPTLIMGAAANVAAGKLFTSPKFINWAYKGIESGKPKALLSGGKPFLGKVLFQELQRANTNKDKKEKLKIEIRKPDAWKEKGTENNE